MIFGNVLTARRQFAEAIDVGYAESRSLPQRRSSLLSRRRLR